MKLLSDRKAQPRQYCICSVIQIQGQHTARSPVPSFTFIGAEGVA